eukprot:Skav207711  [mRNA]  locus=scaffold1347:76320:79559:+ [translate_table: standard]
MRGEIDPGTARVAAALSRVGQPQVTLRGKRAGFRVGMLTSPHLLEPLDAIQLAGQGEDLVVNPQLWKSLEDEVQKACGVGGYASESSSIALTIFELQVVTALLLFARQQVDVAIIEVLGGPRSESVKATIADIAHSVGAPLSWVPPADIELLEDAGNSSRTQSLRVQGFNHVLEVPLLGDYQRSNAALALAMLLELRSRMVLLDGAHNPHAAKELASYVDRCVRPRPVRWVIALSFGKDARGILQELLRDEDKPRA